MDLVAVVRGRPDSAAWEARLAHPDVAGARIDLLVVDGAVLGAADRSAGDGGAAAVRIDGGRTTDAEVLLDALLWRELGTTARTVVGEPLASSLRPVERAELVAAVRRAASRTWLPWLQGTDRLLGGEADDTPVSMATVECAVLGSLRAEHTLRTGELASKRLALRTGLVWYGERWSDVLEPVGAVRDGLGIPVVTARWARRGMALALEVTESLLARATRTRQRLRTG